MVKRNVSEILDFISEKLSKKRISVYKVILFGSYYNGDPNSDSDIDIAIVSNDFVNKNPLERGKLLRDIELETINRFDIPVDFINLTIDEYENETRMIVSYVKEGKVVYSAN
ncbi:MAG: nucleotidyltransferase domain-containing protein [Ignavibacteriales bacterium]|nr:nucleotidyltransferase domain-containing protein [Ignavibacteriales bacterium]